MPNFVAIAVPAEGSTTTGPTVVASGTASGAVTGYLGNINTGKTHTGPIWPQSPGNWSITFTGVEQGQCQVKVWLLDNQARDDVKFHVRQLRHHNAPTSVEITDPKEGDEVNVRFTATGTAPGRVFGVASKKGSPNPIEGVTEQQPSPDKWEWKIEFDLSSDTTAGKVWNLHVALENGDLSDDVAFRVK